MKKIKEPETCQLTLTLDLRRNIEPKLFGDVIRATNTPCVILYDSEGDEAFLQKQAEPLIPIIQDAGAAVLIAEDSRMVGRLKADGIHVSGKMNNLTDVMFRLGQQIIVGFGEVKDRHTAMEAGEASPAYIMFGKLGADKTPDAHPRNLALGNWWAQMMEIPAIVQAGSTIKSVEEACATGAEFVSAEAAIFGENPVENDVVLQNATDIADILKKHFLNTGNSKK